MLTTSVISVLPLPKEKIVSQRNETPACTAQQTNDTEQQNRGPKVPNDANLRPIEVDAREKCGKHEQQLENRRQNDFLRSHIRWMRIAPTGKTEILIMKKRDKI